MTTSAAVTIKSFEIDKWEVWQAWKQVAANQGAPGVDGQSIVDFAKDLKNNLYRVWNRMSAGSYFPSPVRAVSIPKADGGARVLGVPGVVDRVAQTVVMNRLTARLEKVFHSDSYGYRPARSAHDAIDRCAGRCRDRAWVVKIDIRSFFDSVDHDLLVRALQRHIDPVRERWIELYVRRWLTTPMAHADGTVTPRDAGTPQGAPVSPVLANLFLHYAFDAWMEQHHPGIWFERFADDIAVHAVTERQARQLVSVIDQRLADVGLQMHPDKTVVVYCRGGKYRGRFDGPVSFDFLGYTFAPRTIRTKAGDLVTVFRPAVSRKALKVMGTRVRRWKLHRRPGEELADLARWMNPIVSGWMNYFGRFDRSKLYPLLRRINAYLMRWARNKYRRLARWHPAIAWWRRAVARKPDGFVHWVWTTEISNAGMGRAV